MTYSITKVFKVDMGHRTWSHDKRIARGGEFFSCDLPYAHNKCANIHGHSLLISITLESDSLDRQNCVIDTDLIKVPFGKVISQMDHAFVMDKNDPLFEDMKKLIDKEGLTLYVVDFSPSFEAIAEHLYQQLEGIIRDAGHSDVLRTKEVTVSGEHMSIKASYRKD